MREYYKKVYKTRYFWLHLVNSELKNKFRRSKLGILWSLLNPLFLTLLMSTVFGAVFKIPMKQYAPYVLSGLIVWDVLSSSFIAGGYVLLSSEQFIRQINHPATIYTLKSSIVTVVNFSIAIMSLVLWSLVMAPENTILGIITLPLTMIIFIFLSWGITTFSAYINVKYRDYPQVMALLIQAVWYVSPVFFQKQMFLSNPSIKLLFELNPITHILNLVRAPFLYGQMPTYLDYVFALGFVVVWGIIGYLTNKSFKDKFIFYL